MKEKEVPAETTTAMAVTLPREPVGMPQFDSDDAKMMALVLSSGSIEAMERYIALRERTEALACQKEFDRRFAEMQQEFVPVPKAKQGHGYKYCTLEAMQKFYQPIISKFGFSYQFKEEELPTGSKLVWCVISGYGHTRSNSFLVPPDPGTTLTNAIQKKAIQSTYGQRYALKAGFGFIVGDADPDGRTESTDEAEDDGSTDDTTCKALIKQAVAAGLKDKRLADIRQRYKSMSGNPKSQATIVRILTTEIELAAKRSKPISMVVEDDDESDASPAPIVASKKGVKK